MKLQAADRVRSLCALTGTRCRDVVACVGWPHAWAVEHGNEDVHAHGNEDEYEYEYETRRCVDAKCPSQT